MPWCFFPKDHKTAIPSEGVTPASTACRSSLRFPVLFAGLLIFPVQQTGNISDAALLNSWNILYHCFQGFILVCHTAVKGRCTKHAFLTPYLKLIVWNPDHCCLQQSYYIMASRISKIARTLTPNIFPSFNFQSLIPNQKNAITDGSSLPCCRFNSKTTTPLNK